MGERRGVRRFGRVLSDLAVNQVEPLGLGVVRLEVGVREGPRGGAAAVMPDLVEVALAQAEEDPAVDLGVATHEVLRVRTERDTVAVVPPLAGDVSLAAEDLPGVPVLALAREVAATLEHQDLLARRRETVRERASAGAGPDDDHVVVVHELPTRRRSASSKLRSRRVASGG